VPTELHRKRSDRQILRPDHNSSKAALNSLAFSIPLDDSLFDSVVVMQFEVAVKLPVAMSGDLKTPQKHENRKHSHSTAHTVNNNK
jgi:hypothetical protein